VGKKCDRTHINGTEMRMATLVALLLAQAHADIAPRQPRKSECAHHSDCGSGKFCSNSFETSRGWTPTHKSWSRDGTTPRAHMCRSCFACKACHYNRGYHCHEYGCDACATSKSSIDGKCDACKAPGPCLKTLLAQGNKPTVLGQYKPQCSPSGYYEPEQCQGANCGVVDTKTGKRLDTGVCSQKLSDEMSVIAKHCCGPDQRNCHGGLPSRCNAGCRSAFANFWGRCSVQILVRATFVTPLLTEIESQAYAMIYIIILCVPCTVRTQPRAPGNSSSKGLLGSLS
jgi:hypothetical protein